MPKAGGVLSVTLPPPGEDATTKRRPAAYVASMVFVVPAIPMRSALCGMMIEASALMVNAKSVMWPTMPAAMTPGSLCAMRA